MKFEFPPVRKMFIPDRHHTLFEIDLAGADAQVVAWTSGDEDLKQTFRDGLKIHVKNGRDIYGPEKMGKDGKAEPWYTKVKRGVHLTNYGGKIPTMARKCGMTQGQARSFQEKWFELHPPIVQWHEDVMFQLQTTRTISNRFGYDAPFFGRPDEEFRKALAWEPQSTVAEVTYQGMRRIYRRHRPQIQLLMQVHDSLVGQVPTRIFHPTMRNLYEDLHSIVIPFDDPLVIPWGLKFSAKSWGAAKEVSWKTVL